MFGANVASESNVPFSNHQAGPRLALGIRSSLPDRHTAASDELWVESNVAPCMGTESRSFQVWEPMESAPLDGTPIVVKNDHSQATVSWSSDMQSWVVGLATEPDRALSYFGRGLPTGLDCMPQRLSPHARCE